MCSPDEGTWRTETSYFFIKSLELMCDTHIFLLFVLSCLNTWNAYLFVTMHYIYVFISMYILHV